MPDLRRHLAVSLRRALQTFPAVLITGPRQAGKSTFVRAELAATHGYVNLERPDLRERAQLDPNGFLNEHPAPLIIDEVQRVPGLMSWLQERIDARRVPGSYVLSGSQSFALMQGVTQSLAGRIAVLTLLPLSCGEAVGSAPRSVDELLERVFDGDAGAAQAPEPPRSAPPPDAIDWLLRGGYPELRANPQVDRQLWFSSYVQTYLERDVRDLIQVGDLRLFQRFLAMIAAGSGRLTNLSDVARELGVASTTAKRWLTVLEASHVIRLLPPWHENFGKRQTKAPKIVMVDPGLAAWLQSLHDGATLAAGPTFGSLFETAVAGEWAKALHAAGEPAALHHWRSSSGLEVDLVLERNGKLYGIECKATSTPTPVHAEAMRKWMKLAGPRARGVIACRVERACSLGEGVRAVPWHLAW